MDISLPSLQQMDLAGHSPVSAYLKATMAVCPFIEPSSKSNCLHGCVIAPDCKTAAEIHPRIFEQIVPSIERFRNARGALSQKQQRLLICHLVLIHLPAHLDAEARQQLTWPNWLAWSLKQLYTPKEIVFGFVRKNIVEKTSFGLMTSPAPFHAIIIRSRVVGSDHRFFPNNQPWLAAMMEADDDGQTVHPPAINIAPDLGDPNALREADYFQRIVEWGKTIVPR